MTSTLTPLTTDFGLTITRLVSAYPYEKRGENWEEQLNRYRGGVLCSNYEYPNRYTRWDTAFVNPPLVLENEKENLLLSALNTRGEVLLDYVMTALGKNSFPLNICRVSKESLRLSLKEAPADRCALREEERSRHPCLFSVFRILLKIFACEDPYLGFYGAFGYDVAFQFESIPLKKKRPASQRDMVLYFPDEILVVDHYSVQAKLYSYEFAFAEQTTQGLSRSTPETPRAEPTSEDLERARTQQLAPGAYADIVRQAKAHFARGDMFEVVPSQVFVKETTRSPAQLHRSLKRENPSPYSFFFNLGKDEYLIGASPEMYVRVTQKRVETCPISGTIRRGRDAIEDEKQILKLLNCAKEKAELTMCSDVDRNDKSRVCVPGSVRVIGHRQIELYSRLIHTVDHIEGTLREGMDALDAFLTHCWVVTVTGAPKRAAMQFIDSVEATPRGWYAGAVGIVHCKGDLNTGLTLRTISLQKGIAYVRAGATLLYDSDPEREEQETELKASALVSILEETPAPQSLQPSVGGVLPAKTGLGKRVLLVDYEDSFVHILADYFRQTGAEVVTYRTPLAEALLDAYTPDVLLLSPGPGRPSDFNMTETIQFARTRGIPIFGVCLGLQGLVEAFGGALGQLDVPVHGKPSEIFFESDSRLFKGLTPPLFMGRYHSLYAERKTLPDVFRVTAQTQDGTIMALEHKTEPISAVQFHPESIMSLGQNAGHRLIDNVILGCGQVSGWSQVSDS